MITSYHFKLDIQGFLTNATKKELSKTFTDDNGKFVSADAARNYLFDCLKEGKTYLPMGKCEGFCYKTGCPGHPVSEDAPAIPKITPQPKPMVNTPKTLKDYEVEIEKIFNREPGEDLQCWITSRGYVIPVDMEGHLRKLDWLVDKGLLPENTHERDIEQIWMKVSVSMFSRTTAIFHEGVATAHQKNTLAAVMEKFKDDFFEGNNFHIVGGKPYAYMAVLEDGKVKFHKD